MKTNTTLNRAILEVVENQLRDLNPPETKEAYDRLTAGGCSDQEARSLIGCIVASEMFDILNNLEPYNHERFVTALRRLPELP